MISRKTISIAVIVFTQLVLLSHISAILADGTNVIAIIHLSDANLHILNITNDTISNTYDVEIMLDYNRPVAHYDYKSDCTSYRINIIKKKYYKFGGFEYSDNLCSGKSMHYESDHTLNWCNDEFFNNPDKWPNLDDDLIAKEIYKYIVKTTTS
jgi:hypothetical protein